MASSYGARWNAPASPVLAEFRDWAERYRTAAEAARAPLVAEGVALAQARRLVMSDLIRNEPRIALEQTVPAVVREAMPPEVVRELEARVEGTGSFLVTMVESSHAHGIGHGDDVRRTVDLGQDRYAAHVYGRRAWQPTQHNASLHGIALDGHMALHESPVRWLESAEKPAGDVVSTGELFASAADGPDASPVVAFARVQGLTVSIGSQEEISLLDEWAAAAEDLPGPEVPILHSYALGMIDYGAGAHFGPTPWTTGLKKILVLPIDFSDLPGWPVSEPDGGVRTSARMLRNRFADEVAPFIASASYGKASLAVTVPDRVYRVQYPAFSYAENESYDSLHRHAIAAAASDWDADAFDVVMVVFSDLAQVGGFAFFESRAGAEVGGSRIWINGWPSWEVLAHELGHSYGLWHAHGTHTVADPFEFLTPLSVEYGDAFDVMGSGDSPGHHFSHVFKRQLGWLSSAQVKEVVSSGVYRIFRSDAAAPASGQFAGLKLPTRNGISYWLGYQLPPATDGVVRAEGAYLRLFDGGNTKLIDLSPETGATDVALGLGRSIANAPLGIALTTLRKGTSDGRPYLDVDVRLSRGTLPVRAWGPMGGSHVWLDLAGQRVHQVAGRGFGVLAVFGSGEVTDISPGSFDPTRELNSVERVFAASSGAFYAGAIEMTGEVVFSNGVPAEIREGVPPGGTMDVHRMSMGATHVVALKRDGSVIAWGSSSTGATTVPAGLSEVVDVAATEGGSCVLRADGSVITWGSLPPKPSAIGAVLAIAPTKSSIVALRWNGMVAEWGNGSGWTSYSSLGTDIRAVAPASESGGLALRENGKVVSWATSGVDELRFKVPLDLEPATGIAVGRSVAAAILNQGAPEITLQPHDRFVPQFTSLKFTAFAVGTGGKLNYRWQRLKPGFVTWENLTSAGNFRGAYSHTLQVASVPAQQSGERYRCVVTEANGTSVTSDDAQVLVEGALVGIAQHPSGQTVDIGGTATLSVKPFGESPFAYQWYKNGAPLAGRTGPQLVIQNVRSGHAGNYSVTVGNEHGVVMSNTARLVVRQ